MLTHVHDVRLVSDAASRSVVGLQRAAAAGELLRQGAMLSQFATGHFSVPFLVQALRSPGSVWYRTDSETGPVDHPAGEHHVDFFNFDLAGIFSLTVSPLELMRRGTLMYWFLFIVFRFVLRRDMGSLGISDFLFVVRRPV